MKTIQQSLKLIGLIRLAMLTMVLSSISNTAFAIEGTGLPSVINPHNARIRLQIDYALKAAQETKNALQAFRAKYDKPMPENTLKWFTDELLLSGKDPFIQAIHYQVEQNLTITMHKNDFVELQLQGLEFVYSYNPEIKQWEFNAEHSSSAATPPPDLLHRARKLIKYFCQRLSTYYFVPHLCHHIWW